MQRFLSRLRSWDVDQPKLSGTQRSSFIEERKHSIVAETSGLKERPGRSTQRRPSTTTNPTSTPITSSSPPQRKASCNNESEVRQRWRQARAARAAQIGLPDASVLPRPGQVPGSLDINPSAVAGQRRRQERLASPVGAALVQRPSVNSFFNDESSVRSEESTTSSDSRPPAGHGLPSAQPLPPPLAAALSHPSVAAGLGLEPSASPAAAGVTPTPIAASLTRPSVAAGLGLELYPSPDAACVSVSPTPIDPALTGGSADTSLEGGGSSSEERASNVRISLRPCLVDMRVVT